MKSINFLSIEIWRSDKFFNIKAYIKSSSGFSITDKRKLLALEFKSWRVNLNSTIGFVELKFTLSDLNSRSKNFLLSVIEKPEDDLMYALILKNLSDRQISIDKKLIDFIVNRISRSYGKISDFIYKIDEISLKRKKPIDFKIIKEALGE